MKLMDEKREDMLWGMILFAAALAASAPVFFGPPVYGGHDIFFHLSHIEGMKDSLLAGQFPVRVDAHAFHGYGMPTSIFYPNVFLYVPALLRISGMPLFTAWEAYLVFANLLTAAASWWAFSVFTKSKRTGAIATLFYLAFLYRLVDLYARSAGGEMMAMAFLPAALVSGWLTLRRAPSLWPSLVLSFTGILQSHIITGLLVLGMYVLMALVSLPRFLHPSVRWAAGKAVVFVFLLNLWFYAPLLYFHHQMDYLMKHIVHGSIEGKMYSLPSMDFYMGSAMLLLVIGAVVFQAFRARRKTSPRTFWGLLLLSSGFVGLSVCQGFWSFLGDKAGVLQFPFRVAMFPAVFLPLALASAFAGCRRVLPILLCAGACFCGNFYWLIGNDYVFPPERLRTAEEQVASPMGNGLYSMRLLDIPQEQYRKYMELGNRMAQDYADSRTMEKLRDTEDPWRQLPLQQKIADDAIHPADRIQEVQRNGTTFRFRVTDGSEEWVQLPLFWYLGYAAEDLQSGEAYPVCRDDDGQVSVLLPPEAGTVRVWYRGLPWFRVTDLVSCISLPGFLYILQRRRKLSKKKSLL